MSNAPETLRTANRLADNEGKPVTIDGLAVDVAGRAAVHLDRSDAIVPVAGLDGWDDDQRGRPVRVRGVLTRHAFENDPKTGLSSLELREAAVDLLPQPDDGRVRTAPALQAAEGSEAEVEGMAYRSRNGNIVVIYGGLVYVTDLPDWDEDTVTRMVIVRGTVRHGPLPPEAPRAGGSWIVEGARLVR